MLFAKKSHLLVVVNIFWIYRRFCVTYLFIFHQGTVSNFQQKSSGDGYVELEWNFTPGDAAYPLHKYTLVTDNDFSNDVRCFDPHCAYVIDYLAACVEHTFEITPHFDKPDGGEILGDTSSTTGFPNDKRESDQQQHQQLLLQLS